MKNFFEEHKKLFTLGGIFVLLIGFIWLNGEHGEPTGVRMTMVGKFKAWESEFALLEASIPVEWENPEKTPPNITLQLKLSKLHPKVVMNF